MNVAASRGMDPSSRGIGRVPSSNMDGEKLEPSAMVASGSRSVSVAWFGLACLCIGNGTAQRMEQLTDRVGYCLHQMHGCYWLQLYKDKLVSAYPLRA